MSTSPEATPGSVHHQVDPSSPVPPRLGLWDAVSIIVGIVVGTSIFRSTGIIFDKAGGPWTAMSLWVLGGVLAWCGAVCYAELATTYPRDGGDYEYLNRAFGTWCGFLFSWAQLATVISGNIAIMAYAFADYAARLPMDVIARMLGVPKADEEQLRDWTNALLDRDEGVPDVPPAGSRSLVCALRCWRRSLFPS